MKLTALTVVFSLFIAGIYASPAGEVPPMKGLDDLPIAVDSRTTKTPKTTTIVTSTTEPSTTQAPETSTTTTPEPTTEAPSTSTTVAPTSSTAAPSTSTIAPPTPEPSIPTVPEVRSFNFTENSTMCIMMEMAVQLNISYTTVNNKLQYALYNLTKQPEAKITGSCGNGTSDQYIYIEWTEKADPNSLNMTFKLNQTTKNFELYEAFFNLSSQIVPNSNAERLTYYHVGGVFNTRQDRSYHCTRVQSLNLTSSENSKETTGTLLLSKVLLEAFHTKSTSFSEAVDCDAINTPDIVPIAVGIALIALVVVVLIAYLVGRRRAQRGYVSM